MQILDLNAQREIWTVPNFRDVRLTGNQNWNGAYGLDNKFYVAGNARKWAESNKALLDSIYGSGNWRVYEKNPELNRNYGYIEVRQNVTGTGALPTISNMNTVAANATPFTTTTSERSGSPEQIQFQQGGVDSESYLNSQNAGTGNPEETKPNISTENSDTTAFGLPAEWRNTLLQMSLGENKQYNLTRPETSQRGAGGVGGSLVGAAIEGLSEGALREANRAATSYAGRRAFERDVLPNIERVYGVDFTRELNASDLTQEQKDRLTRIAEQNPEREQRVLNRMLERAPIQYNPATSEFNAEQELAMRKRLMEIEDELIRAREARDEARQVRLMNEQAKIAQQLYDPETIMAQYTTTAQGTTAR